MPLSDNESWLMISDQSTVVGSATPHGMFEFSGRGGAAGASAGASEHGFATGSARLYRPQPAGAGVQFPAADRELERALYAPAPRRRPGNMRAGARSRPGPSPAAAGRTGAHRGMCCFPCGYAAVCARSFLFVYTSTCSAIWLYMSIYVTLS